MSDQPKQTSDLLSACHNAPVNIVGGIGDFSGNDRVVTMHYECSRCHELCGLAASEPDHDPIPPEGCTCGALWTVRGKHGKKDCPYNAQPQPAESGELRDAISEAICSLPDGFMAGDSDHNECVDAIEHLIASRLRTVLDELETEGPKDAQETEWSDKHQRFVLHREEEVNGFNAANDQWRALLARKKEQL